MNYFCIFMTFILVFTVKAEDIDPDLALDLEFFAGPGAPELEPCDAGALTVVVPPEEDANRLMSWDHLCSQLDEGPRTVQFSFQSDFNWGMNPNARDEVVYQQNAWDDWENQLLLRDLAQLSVDERAEALDEMAETLPLNERLSLLMTMGEMFSENYDRSRQANPFSQDPGCEALWDSIDPTKNPEDSGVCRDMAQCMGFSARRLVPEMTGVLLVYTTPGSIHEILGLLDPRNGRSLMFNYGDVYSTEMNGTLSPFQYNSDTFQYVDIGMQSRVAGLDGRVLETIPNDFGNLIADITNNTAMNSFLAVDNNQTFRVQLNYHDFEGSFFYSSLADGTDAFGMSFELDREKCRTLGREGGWNFLRELNFSFSPIYRRGIQSDNSLWPDYQNFNSLDFVVSLDSQWTLARELSERTQLELEFDNALVVAGFLTTTPDGETLYGPLERVTEISGDFDFLTRLAMGIRHQTNAGAITLRGDVETAIDLNTVNIVPTYLIRSVGGEFVYDHQQDNASYQHSLAIEHHATGDTVLSFDNGAMVELANNDIFTTFVSQRSCVAEEGIGRMANLCHRFSAGLNSTYTFTGDRFDTQLGVNASFGLFGQGEFSGSSGQAGFTIGITPGSRRDED